MRKNRKELPSKRIPCKKISEKIGKARAAWNIVKK
jgi:hypothetical protein